MLISKLEVTIFFYNPNIHPKKEYEIRKNEIKRHAEKLKIPFIDADYDAEQWFCKTEGLEDEPERGKRCSECFDVRLKKTAFYAYNNGFKLFATSLSISRWKDMSQVNTSGLKTAQNYEGLVYWDYNWRKDSRGNRMYEIAKTENFYKQEYCGCIYSLRDVNLLRKADGRRKIQIGDNFYEYKT